MCKTFAVDVLFDCAFCRHDRSSLFSYLSTAFKQNAQFDYLAKNGVLFFSPFEKNRGSNIVTSSRSPEGSDATFYYVVRQHHNFSLSPDL